MDIKQVFKRTGIGVVALSQALGLSRGAASNWKTVPPEHVLALCEISGWKVTPHEVRPDLYPNPNDALPLQFCRPCECGKPFGAFGEPRSGMDRREGERRQLDSGPDCDLGESRDGDRRNGDRREGVEEKAA